MLPLSLLNTAIGHPMLIEMKNGDTYNGVLKGCNVFMNVILEGVIYTSKDGDKFAKMNECYIRGNSIKYMRIADEILGLVEEFKSSSGNYSNNYNSGRGSYGGRGRGMNSGGRGRGRFSGRGDGGRGRGRSGGYSGRGRGGGYSGRGGDNKNYNNDKTDNITSKTNASNNVE